MAGSFVTKIELVDEATAKLKTLNKEFRAAQAPMKAYQRELAQYNKLSGYDDAMKARKQHLADMKKGFSSLKGSVGSVIGPVAGLGKTLMGVVGLGSVMGVVKLTQNFANWGQEIRNASALLGVAGDQVVKLNQMSKLTGLDQIGGLKNYQDTQAQAASGMNAQAQFADNMLGINPNMKFEDAQLQAMKKVQELQRQGVVNQAGGRNLLSAAGLDPALMDQDIARFERMQKAARDNANEMAPFIKQAEDLSDKFHIAGGRVGVLATKLEAALAPAVDSLLDAFIDWSKDGKNVDAIMDDIKEVANDVATAIRNIDWKTVANDTAKFFKEAKKLYDKLGGVEGLLTIFVALKAISFTSWAITVVSDIAKITKAFTAMTTAGNAAKALKVGGSTATAAEVGGSTTTAAEVGGAVATTGGAAIGGAAAGVAIAGLAAGYTGHELYKTYKHDHSEDGIIENRQKQLKIDHQFHSSSRFTHLEQQERKMEMMDYLVKQKGLKPEQAAVMVGNVQQESGFNEKAIGDHGHAYGILQEQRPREKAIEKQFGKSLDKMTWQEQLDASIWEQSTSEKSKGFLKSNDVGDASKRFLDTERPAEYIQNGAAGSEYANRTKNAQLALAQYQDFTGKAPTLPEYKNPAPSNTMLASNSNTPAKADVSGDLNLSVTIDHKGQASARIDSHTLPVNPKIKDIKTQSTSQPRIGGR